MKFKVLATALLGLVVLMPPAFSIQAFAQVQALSELPFIKKLALARAGDNAAKLAVGEAYENGRGARVNTAEAAKWYRQAALAGVLDAQYRLALIVEKGAVGVKPDKTAALKLLQAAANKGHAQSQWAFGQRLHMGDGLPKDDKLAALWVHKAAEQGLAVAENDYATMLLHGWGAERNLDEAFKWFAKGAEQGDLWAMNNLGGMYEQGWGTTQNKDKAVEQYQNAAAKGNEGGRKNLERLGLPLPAIITP
jgi:uncharacterized protein